MMILERFGIVFPPRVNMTPGRGLSPNLGMEGGMPEVVGCVPMKVVVLGTWGGSWVGLVVTPCRVHVGLWTVI